MKKENIKKLGIIKRRFVEPLEFPTYSTVLTRSDKSLKELKQEYQNQYIGVYQKEENGCYSFFIEKDGRRYFIATSDNPAKYLTETFNHNRFITKKDWTKAKLKDAKLNGILKEEFHDAMSLISRTYYCPKISSKKIAKLLEENKIKPYGSILEIFRKKFNITNTMAEMLINTNK